MQTPSPLEDASVKRLAMGIFLQLPTDQNEAR